MDSITVNKRLIPLASIIEVQKYWYNHDFHDNNVIIVGTDSDIDKHRILFKIKTENNEQYISKQASYTFS